MFMNNYERFFRIVDPVNVTEVLVGFSDHGNSIYNI